MPKPLTLTLTSPQRSALQAIVKRHPKAYLRERAAALLQLADGSSARQVAASGLLQARQPQTVCTWCKRYQADGLSGLLIKKGRGRKPAFQPKFADSAQAQEALLHQLAQPPGNAARWSLETLLKEADWLQLKTPSGLHKLLKRLKLHYKRGRLKVHSPDPDYLAKLQAIVTVLQQVQAAQGRLVLLFADQLTYYRQPTLASDYGKAGRGSQPVARLSHQHNTTARIAGAVNALTGQVTYIQASKIGVRQLCQLYEKLRQQYPQAERIYVVLDNWPVHYHADLLAELETQKTPFELKTPTNWRREPSRSVKGLKLPIQLLPLPTYASWANPIEKLWKHLKQYCLHLHRLADDWEALKKKVNAHLEQFTEGSAELLRYIGLSENSKLYGAVFAPNPVPT